MEKCTLCYSNDTEEYYAGKSRKYFFCLKCSFVFVPDVFLLPSGAEKKLYDNHENSPDDLVYQEYLKQIMNPVLDHILTGAKGLDFGSGPGPTLHLMFRERGFETDIYDAFYAPDESVFQKSYDFITVCEVVEHFFEPRMELDRLFSMLNTNGVLAIKTQMLPHKDDFSTWYYKRDRTHVGFFSESCCSFLAEKWKAKMIFVDSNIVLFIKA